MNLIELQPDDVLVLRCPGRMSQAQRDAAFTSLRLFIGPDRKVLILDGDQALDVIRVSLSGQVETNDIVRRADLQAELIARNEELGRQQAEAWGRAQQREVQHVDVPEEEPAGIPPHVWLYRNMLTDMQALAPLGRDETNGQYAVAVDQLTEDQRVIPHVARQLDYQATSRVEVVGLDPED